METARKLQVAQTNQKMAEQIRGLKDFNIEDLEILYGIAAMLGGLETLRLCAQSTEGWNANAEGMRAALGEHFDAIEKTLKKYRGGILSEPAEETATA